MRTGLLSGLIFLSINLPLLADEECAHAGVSLQVLGSGGPELDDGRASSGYAVLQHGVAKVLVDTGSGSAQNFERAGLQFETIEAVLLTHLHVDHSADLPAYIKGSYFTRREQDLALFGPMGNALMPGGLTSSAARFLFPVI